MTAGISIGIVRQIEVTQKTEIDSAKKKERKSARRSERGKRKNSAKLKRWPKKSKSKSRKTKDLKVNPKAVQIQTLNPKNPTKA